MLLARWLARLVEGRHRARQRREFHEVRDVCVYLSDQEAAVSIEIVRIEAELTGLQATRDRLRVKRDEFERTLYQTEALYRSA